MTSLQHADEHIVLCNRCPKLERQPAALLRLAKRRFSGGITAHAKAALMSRTVAFASIRGLQIPIYSFKWFYSDSTTIGGWLTPANLGDQCRLVDRVPRPGAIVLVDAPGSLQRSPDFDGRRFELAKLRSFERLRRSSIRAVVGLGQTTVIEAVAGGQFNWVPSNLSS